MEILIVILLIVLLWKFPPGTEAVWTIGGAKVVCPIGWCIASSVVTVLILSVFKIHTQ